jgi:hypothetical protein
MAKKTVRVTSVQTRLMTLEEAEAIASDEGLLYHDEGNLPEGVVFARNCDDFHFLEAAEDDKKTKEFIENLRRKSTYCHVYFPEIG